MLSHEFMHILLNDLVSREACNWLDTIESDEDGGPHWLF